MNTAAETPAFPGLLDSVETKPKGKLRRLLDVIEERDRLAKERGGLISQHEIADLCGVTRGRVWQWVEEGRLETVQVGQTRLVLVESFKEFARKERPPGRPRKSLLVEAVRQGWAKGTALGYAVVGEEKD